jgi:NADPH:quinone reductase-like Zn-dependent oxidoreductase
MQKMIASVREKYGPPDVIKIEEVGIPVPEENEVLVRVLAATANRTIVVFFRAGHRVFGSSQAL